MIVKINGSIINKTTDFKQIMKIEDNTSLIYKMIGHYQKNRKLYINVFIITAGILIGSYDIVFAGGIDSGGKRIYSKLIEVGKWVIIIKGGIDTIQKASQGDFDGSKRSFLSYLLIYTILWALPWGMNQIDEVFKDEGVF